MIAWRMVRTARQDPPAGHSPRRASVRAFLRSAPGSRRSSLERAPPRARRTDRIARRLRTSASRTCRKALSLSWRRRASALQRASPRGMYRRLRPPRPGDALRRPCRGRPPCVRACDVCSSRAPSCGGFRDPFHRRASPRLYPWRSGRARRPAPSLGRVRTCFARVRAVGVRTSDTDPSLGVRRRDGGGVRALSFVPPRGPCTASIYPPLSAGCFGQKIPWRTPPSTGYLKS